jgi:hypothetical protein
MRRPILFIAVTVFCVELPTLVGFYHTGLRGHSYVVSAGDDLGTRNWMFPDHEKCGDTWKDSAGLWYTLAYPTWNGNKEFETYEEAASYLDRICRGDGKH